MISLLPMIPKISNLQRGWPNLRLVVNNMTSLKRWKRPAGSQPNLQLLSIVLQTGGKLWPCHPYWAKCTEWFLTAPPDFQDQHEKRVAANQSFRRKVYWQNAPCWRNKFFFTRPFAALWAAGLGWIVGRGYSLGGSILRCSQRPQRSWKTMETNQKPWKTLKPP